MKLTLDRLDLKSEHVDRNCSTVRFEHFKPEVQAAIVAVGRATFYEFERDNYNAIYPPKDVPPPQPNDALLAEIEQLRAAQADTNRIRKVRDEWLEIALAHKKKIDTLLAAAKHLLLALDPNKEQMLHNQAEAMALVRDAIYQVETKGVKANES